MDANINLDNQGVQSVEGVKYSAEIKERNKKNNKEKISFWNFLTYATKSELVTNALYETLFWVGLTEIFIFVICFALFLSKPSQLAWLLFCIFHPVRSVIGFLILKILPKTHNLVDNLKDIENSTTQQIYEDIINAYKNNLEPVSGKLRKLVLFYWAFTILNFLIDAILFICLFVSWGDETYNFRNMTTIIVLSIFFCKKYI